MVCLVFDYSTALQGIKLDASHPYTGTELKEKVKEHFQHFLGDKNFNFYLLHNGKLVENNQVPNGVVQIIPRICGGKGGFGSMLRAIGAQIEKTTNREACRDLSGRRLRDINEEKRLKKWIAEQAEREQEALKRKRKKLEKLNEIVKHDFKDEDYTKARLEMPDKIHEAVEQGLKATSEDVSSESLTSTSSATATTSTVITAKSESHSQDNKSVKSKSKKKIKGSLWVDDLEGLEDSDLDSESEDEIPQKKIKLS